MLKYRMAHFGTAAMLLITMWFTMSASAVHAHFQTIAYSEISIQDKTINYALFLDPYELLQVFPDLDANSDMYVDAEDVLHFRERLFEYVQTNLTAKNDILKAIKE
ncbi:hypothetical protein ACFPYJ_20680 [Paenibacillus solisilvae]|uniref:DUF1007 family protein n=1 Tax=Paenibacillus solisilvae TaxID=2486751 RepID=A0ABW0W3F0_9BACL